MILLVDNYDSFVHNLSRYLQELGCQTHVVRNDAFSVSQILSLVPEAIIVSPGPGTPATAGISLEVIRELGPRIPLLGVCLGHQGLAAAWGGKVIRAPEPVHGRTSLVTHGGDALFQGIPNPFRAMRYHSLIVDEVTLPGELQVIARTAEQGIPMALRHRHWPLYGVQFHPESVLTEQGHRLLKNFLRLAGVASGPLPTGEIVPQEPELSAAVRAALQQRPVSW